MNLTRMRQVDWVNKMTDYYAIYKYNITWGDQCLINIFFHFYPGKLVHTSVSYALEHLCTSLQIIVELISIVQLYGVLKYPGMRCFFCKFHTEGLLTFPCEWNTRPDHCMYGMHCQSSNSNGASIIHGNREVFHNEKQPAFKAVYQGFRDVSIAEYKNRFYFDYVRR